MSRLDRDLAARLTGFHERQENQEMANVLEAGGAELYGCAMKNWGGGLITRRAASFPDNDSPNQITGFGPDKIDRLGDLVAWFDAAGCACHFSWPGTHISEDASATFLAHGFAPSELDAWMAARVDEVRVKAPPHDIRVVAKPADAALYARAVNAGWGLEARQDAAVAEAALGCWPGPADWIRYVVFVDNQIAGEAMLTLFGDVAYLAEASTVPAFRRRGVQRALIARRADDARAAGAEYLFGSVKYGDQSWANMAAMGLRDEFMSIVWKRPPRANP